MSPLSRIVERYRNILVPPPARGPNVCVTCRRSTDGYARCWQCNNHFREFGAELADEVVFISMAVENGQLTHVLGKYKNGERPEMRKQFTDELAYVLATFLARHLHCLGEFDLVTVVPSTRQPRPDGYSVHAGVAGRRVLLIDDQWTSGASLQSSAIALKRAGAARVVGLVVGRRVDTRSSGAFDWDACCLCRPAEHQQ